LEKIPKNVVDKFFEWIAVNPQNFINLPVCEKKVRLLERLFYMIGQIDIFFMLSFSSIRFPCIFPRCPKNE
jgi:hypothetical protein